MRMLRLTLLLAAAPAGASAQFVSTGTTPGSDSFWSVMWQGLVPATAGLSGSLANAFVPGTIPVEWQANSSLASWIAATPTASLPGGDGSGNQRIRYAFSQTFNPGNFTSWSFDLGWDNVFFGAFLGGSTGSLHTDGNLLLDPSAHSVFAINRGFGFCRDGDAVFPTAARPNCTANFTLAGLTPNQLNTVTFVLDGDGTTDGLYLRSVGGMSAVPEPATMLLLATGLVALGGVGLWRRYRAS